MFNAKIENKKTGEITKCKWYYKDDEKIFYNPQNTKEIYNIDEYNIIPLHPYEMFGVECGQGWRELYLPLLNYIEEYNKDKADDEKIYPLQIKEKWAHLEIYTNFVTPELDNMINEAYIKSATICEDCGSKEDVGIVTSGWQHTICYECLKKEVKEKNTKVCWYRNNDKKRYWVYPDGHLEEILK